MLEERQHPGLAMVLRDAVTDRLRLDVAMVDRGEIFSWVGASKFDDAGIDHLVHNGPIATGAFGAFLVVVFEQDTRTFTFEKYMLDGGRSLMEYSFDVAVVQSRYKLLARGGSWIYVAYNGTIQLDPETDEVVRMTLRIAEPPPATNVCMTTTTLDFGMAHIGGVDFPLPTRARQWFVLPDGEEAENSTSFANCREYIGESTIQFVETAPAAGRTAKSAPSPPPSVPANLRFTIELTAPIPADTAAAGDPFTGRLVAPLRDGKRTLAPAGALVEGRLLRVQSFHVPPVEVILALKPEHLLIGGSKVPLAAVRDWTQAVLAARMHRKPGVKVLMPLPGEEQAGVFQFAGKHVVVKKGFRSDWRTVPAREPAGARR